MKLKIAHKLLIMFMLIASIPVVMISTVTNYNISTGFSSYLAETELDSIDLLPQLLLNEYKREKSWQRVFASAEIMNHLFARNEQMHNPELGNPGPGGDGPEFDRPGASPLDPYPPARSNNLQKKEFQGEDRLPPSGPDGLASRDSENDPTRFLEPRGRPPDPNGPQFPPPFPPFRIELFKRIGVFDQDGNLLWGSSRARLSPATIPLVYEGKQIGSLKLAASDTLSKEMDSKFVAEQSQNLFWICAVSLVPAALAAIMLSRDFVGAINGLVEGTRQLANGKLKTRIKLIRSDELGQLAGDFNTLASTLEQHDRAHKQWLADTSHELRTPVAVLWAQVEALQDGIQEASPRTLAVLHEEVKNLAKMIDDLHDLARYDVDQLKFCRGQSEIATIIREVFASFEERFLQKRISCDLSEMQNFECVLQIDAARIRQLFSNLLENSLRYTDDGGKLKIMVQKTTRELVIDIDDSAPGVPQELLTCIFDRFYRVESSRSRDYGGSGLGLAICRTIVEGHNGSIRALPSPLGGLRVHLTLPLMEENENG